MTSVTNKELFDYVNNLISTMEPVADNVLDTAKICKKRDATTLCADTIKKVDEFKTLLVSFEQFVPLSDEDMYEWNAQHISLKTALSDLVKNQVSILRADGHYSLAFFSKAEQMTDSEIEFYV